MTYKFNGDRYMTKGIQAEIPFDIQTVIWLLINENVKKGLKMDYLQVFNLSPCYKDGIMYQRLIHSQEVPKRKKELTLYMVDKAITAKIFVIDDIDHITMLLADEY